MTNYNLMETRRVRLENEEEIKLEYYLINSTRCVDGEGKCIDGENLVGEETNLYGPEWVDETFNLAYVLQQWRCPVLLDPSQNRDDFKEEYEYIHSVSSYNWHMYEEGPDNI